MTINMKAILSFFLLFFSLNFVAQTNTVEVTFNLNTEYIEVAESGVYVTGGTWFGTPGDNQMLDDDGDGVYSITLTLPADSSSYYTFTNGACPDYSCKENIGGQDCANPANFNDRLLETATSDIIINTCFGECSTDGTCTPPEGPVEVTFRVSMENENTDASGVYIGANFDSWTGGISMADDNGDDVWEYTTELEPGQYEYKFINGANWAIGEEFDSLSAECTLTTGQFINRVINVEQTMQTPIYYFNSCDFVEEIVDTTDIGEMGDSVMFSINVNMENEEVSDEGVYIAGGTWFGSPGDYELTDEDGDNVYSASFSVPRDSSSYFTITNGACADYACKENIAGQSCANPDNFNDRLLTTETSNVTLNTCFGECTTNGTCSDPLAAVMVTFEVDMTNETVNPDGIFMGGNFENWTGGISMTDSGDNVWSYSAELEPGQYEYKFINGPNWAIPEEFDSLSAECTLTTGQFTNRLITVEEEMTVRYCFNSCDTECEPVGITNNENPTFQLIPNIATNSTLIQFNTISNKNETLTITNINGKTIFSQNVIAGTQNIEISVSDFADGVYFVTLNNSTSQQTQKLVVQH